VSRPTDTGDATRGRERSYIEVGTIIAGYRVDGVLGEGGMGVVYRATQLSLSRRVALKLLAAGVSQDPTFRERFRREGLLQATLDHPHIVTVYEAGDTEHGLFLAMRLVRGPTIKELTASGPLEPGRLLHILMPVAEALDAAHNIGLIHRDIKPQNIMVEGRDHAYLADFGLTKAYGEAGLTDTGQFVGTIDYVSPEQIQGEPATEKSDVYSLTGVLYECLTGRVPFERPSEAAVIYAHVTEPPPRPSEGMPELPGGVDEVIATGMAKDPNDRFDSAAELMRRAAGALGLEGTVVAGTGLAPARGQDGQSTVHAPGGATTASGSPLSQQTVAAGATVRAPAGPGGAATAPARPTRRRASRRGILVLGAALVAVAAVAGFLVGGSGSEDESVPLSNTASAGSLSLSFPAGWERVPEQPRIAGLHFENAIVLSPAAGSGDRMVAGQTDGSGRTLLPAALLDKLPGDPPEGEAVRLGKLEAYRYTGLKPADSRLTLTIFTIPTSSGIATIACAAESGGVADFVADCERSAGSATLAGGEPLPLGPSRAYARRVSAAIDDLAKARSERVDALQAARLPDKQAAAAERVADAYRAAARSVRAAAPGPADREAGAALAAALTSAAEAYQRIATAAREDAQAAYDRARDGAKRAEKRVQQRLADLEELGYSVAG
jgi:hypothetical protein